MYGCVGKDLNVGPVEFEGPMEFPNKMSSKQMVA